MLVIINLLWISLSFAANYGVVVNQIKKRVPELSIQERVMLANEITKSAKKHKINPRLLTAILIQESRLKLGAFNSLSKDFGISQINIRTIRAFKLDQKKLMTHLAYSINAGALVLNDFKMRYEKLDKYYWTRYNTSDPQKREIYKQLVLRHW